MIKGQGCDSSKQQRIFQETITISAPIMSTNTFFLMYMIHAKDKCNVATTNIPGFFLQTLADKNKELLIQIEQHMTRALLQIDLDRYKPAIFYKRGKLVI